MLAGPRSEEVGFAHDSALEGGGFEPPVPRQRRHPSATANHLASYHLPRKLGLRFAPKASTPSRKSSEPRRPVFKIELKPRRSAMTLSLPANRSMHRPCYSGPRPAHPPCSPDGSRARTEDHP